MASTRQYGSTLTNLDDSVLSEDVTLCGHGLTDCQEPVDPSLQRDGAAVAILQQVADSTNCSADHRPCHGSHWRPGPLPLGVRVAVTSAQRKAVFRFRFDVYHREQKKLSPAVNLNDEVVLDAEDKSGLILYTANAAGAVESSLRLNSGCAGLSAAYRRTYPIDRFSDVCRIPMRQISVTSRLMVARDMRNEGLARRLMAGAYVAASNNDIVMNFIHCAKALTRYFGRIGYRQCAPSFVDEHLGERFPMVIFSHAEYLHAIRSPLAPFSREKRQSPLDLSAALELLSSQERSLAIQNSVATP